MTFKSITLTVVRLIIVIVLAAMVGSLIPHHWWILPVPPARGANAGLCVAALALILLGSGAIREHRAHRPAAAMVRIVVETALAAIALVVGYRLDGFWQSVPMSGVIVAWREAVNTFEIVRLPRRLIVIAGGCWLFSSLIGAWVVWRHPWKPGLFCPACRYDLRGLEHQRCPECGRPFTWEELGVDASTLSATSNQNAMNEPRSDDSGDD